MLDTKCRKYFQPFIRKGANRCIGYGLNANQVTLIALGLGLLSGIFVYFGLEILGVLTLWVSGYFDAVDGTVARIKKESSAFGTVMDITFDRMVEGAIIIGVALRHSEFRLNLIFLTISIIISMTIFLTTGPLAENKGEKTFYYQAGLAERTEGFIFFSIIIFLGHKAGMAINIFTVVVIITAIQRFIEAKKILEDRY